MTAIREEEIPCCEGNDDGSAFDPLELPEPETDVAEVVEAGAAALTAVATGGDNEKVTVSIEVAVSGVAGAVVVTGTVT